MHQAVPKAKLQATSARTIAAGIRRATGSDAALGSLYLLTLVVVALLVLTPIAALIYGSLRSSGPGMPGEWTLANYTSLGSANILSSIWMSLYIGGVSSFLCVVIGVAVALVVHRTDFKYKNLMTSLLGLAFYFPSFILAMGWIIIGSPGGVLNSILRDVFGIESGLTIYSVTGIIFVTVLNQIPFVYLLLRGPIINMDGVFEEAALTAGANGRQVLFRITLPLLSYSLCSAFILVLALNIEQFAIPAMIGIPSHITVLPTQLYLLVNYSPPNYGLASSIGLALSVITAVLIVAQRRLAKSGRMATITGKSGRLKYVALGRWKWPAYIFCGLIILLNLVLPCLFMAYVSLIKFYTSNPLAAQYTLRNFEAIWSSASASQSMRNTIVVSGLGAGLGLVLAFFSSYFTVRVRPRGYRVLDIIASLPFGVPGIVMGLGLLWAYAYLPLPIYGTLALIIIVLVTRYLPYGTEAVGAGLVQISTSLEEAAWVSGATKLVGLRRVLVPLALPAIQGAYFLLFMAFFREISSVVLLYTADNQVISVSIWAFFEGGNWDMASAFSLVATVFIFCVIWVVLRVLPTLRKA